MVFYRFQIYKLSLKSEHCSNIHHIIPIECICAFAAGEMGDRLRLAFYYYLKVTIFCGCILMFDIFVDWPKNAKFCTR